MQDTRWLPEFQSRVEEFTEKLYMQNTLWLSEFWSRVEEFTEKLDISEI